MSQTAGLVLAAGAGHRYGSPKAVVVLNGERLVDRAVRVLTGGGCHHVFVVLGAWVGPVDAATVVVNRDWGLGLASSLRCGLRAVASSLDCNRVMVSLVDLPGLNSAAVSRVLAAEGDLVAASHNGVRGHPVVISRSHWNSVAADATGDHGARDYLDRHAVTLVEVGDIADLTDLDTPSGHSNPAPILG